MEESGRLKICAKRQRKEQNLESSQTVKVLEKCSARLNRETSKQPIPLEVQQRPLVSVVEVVAELLELYRVNRNFIRLGSEASCLTTHPLLSELTVTDCSSLGSTMVTISGKGLAGPVRPSGSHPCMLKIDIGDQYLG